MMSYNITVVNQTKDSELYGPVVTDNTTVADIYCERFFAFDAEPPELPMDIELIKQLTYQVFLPAIAAIGIVGNVLNLAVLHSFKGRTYFYLFCLAITDLVAMIMDALFSIAFLSSSANYTVAFLACHLVPTTSGIFVTCSNLLVLTLTIERFSAVCIPIKTRLGQKNERPIWVVALCILLGFMIFGPTTFMWEVRSINLDTDDVRTTFCHICRPRRIRLQKPGRMYYLMRETLSRVIPVVLVAVLNTLIIIALTRHQRQRTKSSLRGEGNEANQTEDRVKCLIMGITMAFVLFVAPITCRHLFFKKNPTSRTYAIAQSVTYLLLHFNTACNFFVYCFCSQAIRKQVKKICCTLFLSESTENPLINSQSGHGHVDSIASLSSRKTSSSTLS